MTIATFSEKLECKTCRSIEAARHCHKEATRKPYYHNDQETAETVELLADPVHRHYQ